MPLQLGGTRRSNNNLLLSACSFACFRRCGLRNWISWREMSAEYALLNDIRLHEGLQDRRRVSRSTTTKHRTEGRKMKNQIKTQAPVTGLKIKTSMVMLAAALIAMITPSAATAGPPSETPTA